MKPFRLVEKLIPSYGRRPLLTALILNMSVYWGARLIAGRWPHFILETAIDRTIPLLPWTVTVYFGSFLFWAVNYILAVRLSKDRAWRFLAADALGKLTCFVLFLALPTTNIRPDLPASGLFAPVMEFLYAVDRPDNLFPSIHCFNSWMCWAGVRSRQEVPAGYRAFSLVMTLAVAVSTLTTKQHVLADAAAGVILAEACWQILGLVWKMDRAPIGGSFSP